MYSKDFPIYSRKQVQEHYNKETGIWVTFKDGVYDISEFIKIHPGGEKKILMAAGGSIEPFWAMYSFHNEHAVKELLQEYRIGTLQECDQLKEKDIPDFSTLKKEAIDIRSKVLVKHLAFPYCAEASEKELSDFFYTPLDLFFVRNHNHIPDYTELGIEDISNYKIKIKVPAADTYKLRLNSASDAKADTEGENEEADEDFTEFNLSDLMQLYPLVQKSTIIACAGNRRKFVHYNGEKTKGLQWGNGAIANGVWEGIPLNKLLHSVLQKNGQEHILKNIEKYHLIAEGNDHDFQNENYSVSVPLKDAYEQGILAFRYNGENIPMDHGYPVRLVLPGYIGVRNVKWVKSLEIADHESQGHYQQRDYKIIKEHSLDKVNMDNLSPVYTWDVNSAILTPSDDQVVHSGNGLDIKGWAIGTKGTEIFKVEVSLDNEKTWRQVDELKFDSNEDGKVYGWTLWKLRLTSEDITKSLLNSSSSNMSLTVRAVDLLGNEQKRTVQEAWNFRGIMNNSYHKVNISLI